MNKIVIQGALQSEIDYLLKIFDVLKKVNYCNYTFYECNYKGFMIIISKTKIGEISSAIATTLAIQKYQPEFIINQGTAGALVDWLNKGDIVVGNKIYYLPVGGGGGSPPRFSAVGAGITGRKYFSFPPIT